MTPAEAGVIPYSDRLAYIIQKKPDSGEGAVRPPLAALNAAIQAAYLLYGPVNASEYDPVADVTSR